MIHTRLVTWLRTCSNMGPITPGTITLRGVVYPAAAYEQMVAPPEGARATKPVLCRRIYVVGQLPKFYRDGRHKYCFTRTDSPYEWFITGYINKERLTAENQGHHPLGANFLLGPWDLVDQDPEDKIDRFEPRKYTREPLLWTPVPQDEIPCAS